MAISPKDVKDIAPELETETNKRLQLFIDIATANINAVEWETRTDTAITLLTAHYLTLANRGGSGGAISSESVGGLSVSYTSGLSGTLLSQTSYGEMLYTMMKSLVISPRVAGC